MRVSKETIDAARRHIVDGVPVEELGVTKDVQYRVERVAHILRWCHAQPQQDPFVLFKALAAGRYGSAGEEWHVAKKDMMLYEIMNGLGISGDGSEDRD